MARRPALHHDVLQGRAILPRELLRNLQDKGDATADLADLEASYGVGAELGQRRRVKQRLPLAGDEHEVELLKEQTATQPAGDAEVGPTVDLLRKSFPGQPLLLLQQVPEPRQVTHVNPRAALGGSSG